MISSLTAALLMLSPLALTGATSTGSEPRSERADQRVAVITGSTGGLGREVARALAAEGWHVVVHGRDARAGTELVSEIENGPGSARFIRADFGSLAEVRDFGETVLQSYDRIDLFLANAGIWLDGAGGRQLSDDGHELHFQVNYLSHFLLSRMFLPLLRETAAAHGDARVIQVASGAQSAIDFDDVMLAREGAHTRGYGQSKLAQILLAQDLAEELAGTGVLSVSLHPATLMDTGMVLDRGIEPRSTVEEGLEAVLNLVYGRGIQSGQYFQGREAADPHPQAFDRDARARLHELSRELTGIG